MPVPVRALDKPDIWWTAAATIAAEYYNTPLGYRPTARDPEGLGRTPSFQPGSDREGSPTRQKRIRWQQVQPLSDSAKGGLDKDTEWGEVKISMEQTWSDKEISGFKSQSSGRRRRHIESNFERRYFTNNPAMVACRKQTELSARPPAMRLVQLYEKYISRLPAFVSEVN